jgi:hypothetical protein
MRTSIKIGLLVAIPVSLACLVVGGWSGHEPRPRIRIVFVGYTNVVGANIARFSVTNTGDATAALYPTCSIEVQEPPTKAESGCRASMKELGPSKEGVIEVFLPQMFAAKKADNTINVFGTPSLAGRWRAKCYFAHTGSRSRSYEFMWSGNGAILRKYIPVKLIPRYFTQLPLDVTATSDWITP